MTMKLDLKAVFYSNNLPSIIIGKRTSNFRQNKQRFVLFCYCNISHAASLLFSVLFRLILVIRLVFTLERPVVLFSLCPPVRLSIQIWIRVFSEDKIVVTMVSEREEKMSTILAKNAKIVVEFSM